MKILVIDDDETAALAISAYLEEHEVQTTGNSVEAIKIATEWNPQLIISDWDLKEGGDGVHTCREILKTLQVPVIFVSGSPLEQLKELASALNPLHYVQKPVDLGKLASLIAAIKV